MKKHLIFLLLGLCVITISWTHPKSILNANSWSITIGDKLLLASWKKNKMGDTAIIDIRTIKSTDTLIGHRYICGYYNYKNEEALAILTVKNQQNEVIVETVSKENNSMFITKTPIINILDSKKMTDNNIFSIYFTIKEKSLNIDETVLLGRLRIN